MKRKLVLLVSLFFIFSYCKNSEKQPQEAFEMPSELRSNAMVLDDFLKNYEQPSQSFIVKGKQPQQLMGANGTLLFINPEDVETLDGKSVGATIQVELKEILSIPEFIINQLQTLSNEKLLVSDGMYYINMTSKGEQLKLKEGKTLKVKLSNNKINDSLDAESLNNGVTGMTLFYGRQKGGELGYPINWVASEQKFEIEQMKQTSNGDTLLIQRKRESVDTIFGYGHDNPYLGEVMQYSRYYEPIELKSFGWINCDKFYDYKGELATPTYKINLSDSIKTANIYVILKDKSLIKSQSFFLKNKITTEPIGAIPINESIKIFAVAYQGDKIYAYQTDFKKVSKNKEETLDLKPISQSGFEEMMRNLAK